MTSAGDRPWLADLGQGLPIRLTAEAPAPGDQSWIVDLYATLITLQADFSPEEVHGVGVALAQAFEARGRPQWAARMRAELSRRSDHVGLAQGLRPALIGALEQGDCVADALGRWLTSLPSAQARLVRAGRAWERLREAVWSWLAALDYCPDAAMRLTIPESLPSQATSAWLRWTHGRRLSRAEARDPLDQHVPNTSGQPHHLATLLLAMTATPRALFVHPELVERLEAREEEPRRWGDVTARILTRLPLRDADDEAEDIRGLPLARMVEAWALLGGGARARSAAHAIEALLPEIDAQRAIAWRGECWPAVRFELREGRITCLQGAERAEDRRSLWWIGRLLQALRSPGRGPGEAAPAQGALDALAELRSNAALAHALHEAADNFAARVFPSVKLWPLFWSSVRVWLEGAGAVALPSARRVSPVPEQAWLWPWELWDPQGAPWSASRLFIEVTRALAEPDARPIEAGLFVARAAAPEAAVPSLCALLQRFQAAAAQHPAGRAAAQRERGVRWRSSATSWREGVAGHEAPRPPWWSDDELEEDWEDETREPAPTGQAPSPLVALPTGCEDCRGLWEALRGLSDWQATPPPMRAQWEAGPLPALFAEAHAALHGAPLHDSVCEPCARRMLTAARSARETIARALLSSLQDAGAPSALQRLLDELRGAIIRLHQSHALVPTAAPPARDPQPQPASAPPAPLVVELRLRGTHAEARAWVAGQLREATTPLTGVEAALGLTTLDAALRRLDPAASEDLARLTGATLGELLLRGDVGRLWEGALHQARASGQPLRLHLITEGDHGRLPWELLKDPSAMGRFYSLESDVSLVRLLPRAASVTPVSASRPPRVLVASAGLPAQVVSQEQRAALAAGPAVRLLERASRRALTEALRAGPWEVLHLAAHGEPGRLILEDGEALDAHSLGELVSERVTVACVVNACWGASARRGRGLPGLDWSGVAGALLARGPAHVVAATSPLRHGDALALAEAWHATFASTGDPVLATQRARRAIRDRRAHGPAFGLIQHFTTAAPP